VLQESPAQESFFPVLGSLMELEHFFLNCPSLRKNILMAKPAKATLKITTDRRNNFKNILAYFRTTKLMLFVFSGEHYLHKFS